MLSTEQGVYVAESVTAKNTKQAKGRFRMYDDEDGEVHYNFFHYLLLDFLSFYFGKGPYVVTFSTTLLLLGL